MAENQSKPRVLLTGAAGNIGSGFRDEYHANYSDHYRLRLGDVKPIRDSRFDEIVQFELEDFQSVRKACEGVQAILHLAANPNWKADFRAALIGPNILGNYLLFEAAREAGVKRIVFASSVHAIMGYPVTYQAHYNDPPRPDSMYGVTKLFGEGLCSAYASLYNISCIAVRIGAYVPAGQIQRITYTDDPQFLDIVVTQRDLSQLFDKLLTAPPNIKYLIANGLSNNRYRRMDIEHLRDLVNYQPQDDAFKLSQLVDLGAEVKV